MKFRQEIIGDARLILGDYRETISSLAFDSLITDPPYPDIEKGFQQTPIEPIGLLTCRQFVFWSAVEAFPLSWSAVHIWHKPNGCSAQHYERIFERNGLGTCRVFREAAILPNYTQYAAECVDHPTQKPLKLLEQIVGMTVGHVADPFMGSGTTGVACMNLGRAFTGIEIDEGYFSIACRRIEQAYKQPRLFAEPVQESLL